MVEVVRAAPDATSVPLEEVAAAVQPHHNLSEVIRWAASLGRNPPLANVITQDEYTHDIVVYYKPGVYLVYAVT